MAEAAVTFLLDNVQKLLVEQMHLISGAEKELKQLQIELELMNAFLMEYADKREKGRVFIQFERQIREAVYEAEDILDACLTQKAQSAATTIRNFMHLHDLAEKVNELRLQLQPIFDRAIKGLNALPIAHPSAATPDDNKFKKTQLLREDNVVGFADEEATLMKYLKEKTEQLDVISIVGMPGLGKTTLAWKIYRDPKIQFEFPTLIWVYVSQELNVREVFLTILKHFTRNDMSGKGEWELTQLVRSHLDKGRFLLFMDDVWSVEDWRRIEAALPKSNKLGKVLITSRHVGVATQTNRSREPHKLRFMTFEESWELLQLEVFGKNNPSPKELEGLGMHIARQCGGVPLAVVVIGGTLVEKCDNKRDWEKISDSVSIYVQDDKRTESIISLSYNNLPHHLRDCFLHSHGFPPNLRMLTLSSTYLGWQHMAALGRLLNLQVLKLKEMAFKGKLWQAKGGGFPQLETLHIERTELEIWTAASAEPFPKLKNLILKNCERLQEIPCVVGKGESLQLVDIERVSHTLLQSAKKIEVEKQQMQGGDVRGRRAGGFKLKISPGDASSSSSSTTN